MRKYQKTEHIGRSSVAHRRQDTQEDRSKVYGHNHAAFSHDQVMANCGTKHGWATFDAIVR